jgi:hypothetical protein
MDLKVHVFWGALIPIGVFTVAHLLRYTPLPGGGPLGASPVWDRWFQRVCVVSFVGDNRVSCSLDAFTGQFSKPQKEARRSLSQIEELREAGFSEREVLEWVEKELKAKRQQGMSDADLAVYLFGVAPKKSGDNKQ